MEMTNRLKSNVNDHVTQTSIGCHELFCLDEFVIFDVMLRNVARHGQQKMCRKFNYVCESCIAVSLTVHFGWLVMLGFFHGMVCSLGVLCWLVSGELFGVFCWMVLLVS